MEQLKQKVNEHEERLLAIVSGNIGLISSISRLEVEVDTLKLGTEDVLSLLKQRQDTLNEEISKLKGYYVSIQQDITTIVKAIKKLKENNNSNKTQN